MSAFLGPIHYWVFNKIKLFEMLEGNLINAYKQMYGDEIDEISKSAQNLYGPPVEDKPLEDLIDTSNIHGWLQHRISAAETRHAAILIEIFKRHGKAAVDLALKLYEAQGSDCGKDARKNYAVNTAPEIYKALNSFLLEGMPCDVVSTVTVNTDDKVEWQNVECLHRGYWEKVNADINTFYDLRARWIRAFVSGANEKFTYNVNTAQIHGETGFVHEIIKK